MISKGTFSNRWAFDLWLLSRLSSSSKARSSLAPSRRRPSLAPYLTLAGLEPKNSGVVESTSSPQALKFSDMWWPSAFQPHGPSPVGSPKTVK